MKAYAREVTGYFLVFLSVLLTFSLFVPIRAVEASTYAFPMYGDYEEPNIYYYPEGTGVPTSPDPLPSDFSAGLLTFNLDMVDVEQVSATGEGIYVAVLDTGLASIWPLFFPPERIADGYGKRFTYASVAWDPVADDFIPVGPMVIDGAFITNPFGSGHGTHVTSTIIGYDYGGTYITGVAPKVKIIPVLVMDTWWFPGDPDPEAPPAGYYTFGFWDMIAAAINYIADLAESEGIKIIISMSLGDGPSPLMENAIDYAISKGVIVVASAGNSGPPPSGYLGWPGAYPQVICVGAAGWTGEWVGNVGPPLNPGFWLEDVPENLYTTDYFGNDFQVYLTYFSSRPNSALGQDVDDLDLCAPGAAVVGPYMIEGDPPDDWGYYYLWGTSMSAPHVAGIAALVLEQHPTLEQAGMEKLLKTAAAQIPLTAPGGSRSADVVDPWGYWTETWDYWEYGRGLLTADTAKMFAKSVGGIWTPISTGQLLTPWIGLVSTALIATGAAVLFKRREKRDKQ